MTDRASKKFNKAATISITVGVSGIITGVTCGIMAILSGAMTISGKRETEL